LMVPFVPGQEDLSQVNLKSANSMDALVKGTQDGIALLVNIVAMLLVLVTIVSLINIGLAALPDLMGKPITLQRIAGGVFTPLMWAIGIPWAEASTAGLLMGSKTVLNEFVAYLELAALPEGVLSPRSRLMLTYALCGFANFASVGIMIGGMGAMLPDRRPELVQLGMKSILSGTIATCLSAALVGML